MILDNSAIVAVIEGDPEADHFVALMLEALGVTIEPVTAEQAAIARGAYRDFGKGRSHPAQLNVGDCFAYALAVTTGDSLLFKGEDFTHTDVQPAADN